MDYQYIFLGVLAGIFAGIINIISGSGSAITLSFLAFLGIPLDIANGTNRIGVFTQGLKGTHSFYNKGELKLNDSWLLISLITIGAIGGTCTAIYISAEQFNVILGFLFCFLFLILLFEPQKKIKNLPKFKSILPWLMIPIGFYGGFIQIATGLFILATIQAVTGKTLREINPLKVFLILIINVPAIAIFAYHHKINWELGIALAVGQYIGAVIGVRINSTSKNIEPALKYLLLALVAISIAKFWGFI